LGNRAQDVQQGPALLPGWLLLGEHGEETFDLSSFLLIQRI
jgi:hypothetical protein